jgi:hypothetical protein
MRGLLFGAVSLSVLSLACGSADPSNFVGAWTYNGGSVTYQCGSGSTDSLEGAVEITEGTESSIVMTFNDCAIGYDLPLLGGNSASLHDGSACGDSTFGITPSTSRLTLSDSGLTQTESGTAMVFGASCPYSLTGNLVRAAQ